MSAGHPSADDLTCRELVGLVTHFLDGALGEAEEARIVEHLRECDGCRAAIDQFRHTIRLAGELAADDAAALDPVVRESLLAAFRDRRNG